MGETSKIQWTDATWNVARGCTKVDSDCKYCYMYRDGHRYKYDPRQVIRTKSVFRLPLKLKEPSKIFTSSLTDMFHPHIDSYRNEIWDIIRSCPQHTFQILTKRPERVNECLPEDWKDGWDNVWIGTSIGHQDAINRFYELIRIPSKTRFISFEPLHEYVDMNLDMVNLLNIHWVIIGGESGNETGMYRYRPCKIEWIKSLMSDFTSICPVFVKQLGTHLSKEMGLKDRHGGDIDEWPEELRIREFPKTHFTDFRY